MGLSAKRNENLDTMGKKTWLYRVSKMNNWFRQPLYMEKGRVKGVIMPDPSALDINIYTTANLFRACYLHFGGLEEGINHNYPYFTLIFEWGGWILNDQAAPQGLPRWREVIRASRSARSRRSSACPSESRASTHPGCARSGPRRSASSATVAPSGAGPRRRSEPGRGRRCLRPAPAPSSLPARERDFFVKSALKPLIWEANPGRHRPLGPRPSTTDPNQQVQPSSARRAIRAMCRVGVRCLAVFIYIHTLIL